MTYDIYDTFNDERDDLVQAWSRAKMIAEITKEDQEEANKYGEQFSDKEQMKIKILLASVSASSVEEVEKRIEMCL